MRIAIIDDEPFLAQEAAELAEDFFGEKGESIFIEKYEKGSSLIHALEGEERFDLYLLDLRLPDCDGVGLLERIRQLQGDARVIVVSSYPEYVLSCVHAGIFDFVPKAEMENALRTALEKLWKIVRHELRRCYCIQLKGNCQKVLLEHIFYIELVSRAAVFHCAGEEYKEYRSLGSIYEDLPEGEFAFINSGQIVNLWRVARSSRRWNSR